MKQYTLKYDGKLFLLCIIIYLQACNTTKKLSSLVYFNQQGDTVLNKAIQNLEPVIQPGDRMGIAVYALDAASAAPYNLGSATFQSSAASALSSGSSSSVSAGSGYIVEANGIIRFPQLGEIQVAGMQRKQLIDTLTQRLVKYLTDPIVTVQFLNFKITVLGEVLRPGTLSVPEGKITLIEAIGLTGDLPVTARRDNILVIREKNGQREFGHINILSKNVFNSPYFVLKQNDVVYVELTKQKAAASDLSTSLIRSNISLVATAVTLISTIVILIVNIKK